VLAQGRGRCGNAAGAAAEAAGAGAFCASADDISRPAEGQDPGSGDDGFFHDRAPPSCLTALWAPPVRLAGGGAGQFDVAHQDADGALEQDRQDEGSRIAQMPTVITIR
jgi:hypothetical protein